MPHSRRLTAIMFADIAGYTAMMQRNEKEGLKRVHRFSEVMEANASANNGEILEFRGDGCMAVFNSAVEAMHAAKAIQESLKEEPKVPLRIGIHIGDIVFTDGNIYGDGVNLASRVESMGVPGSILVTERVIHDVKSHPEFEMASLGKFQFKNVEEPMEVFALANEGFVVPTPIDMKGKGKSLTPSSKGSKISVQNVMLVFLILGMGLTALYWFALRDIFNSQLLSEEIRVEKVAVAVFENRTQQKNLDALGFLGSEWISTGLRELGIRTVSPEMVRRNRDLIGILPDDPTEPYSFAEITGASFIITGSYYLRQDTIELITSLSSALDGEEVQPFPRLKRHIDEKEQLVDDAREYLLGYWVLKRDQKLPTVSPPKYEAYQQFLTCFINTLDCHKSTLELDEDFLLAWASTSYSSVLFEEDSLFEESQRILKKRWESCTLFEQNLHNSAIALHSKDYEQAFKWLYKNYELDPKDYIMLNEAAYMASAGLNKPELAIEMYKDMITRLSQFESKMHDASLYHYLDALNRLGRHEEVITFYEEYKDQLLQYIDISEVLLAYIILDRDTEIQSLLEVWKESKLLHWRVQDPVCPELFAAYIYKTIHSDRVQTPYDSVVKANLSRFKDPSTRSNYRLTGLNLINFDSRATAHYVLGEWDKAEKVLLELRGYDWDSYPFLSATQGQLELWIEGWLGTIYGHMGDTVAAMNQISMLDQFQDIYFNKPRNPFVSGSIPYLKARILSVLGKKREAVSFLKQAIKEGRMYIWWNITMDIDFVPLRGYKDFEELIKPNG